MEKGVRSPFPGMDPYLERYWGDIHTSLVVYARNQLNAQLPDDLQARVLESLAVAIDDRTSRLLYPDVRVVEEPSETSPGGESRPSVVAVAEPCVLLSDDESRLIDDCYRDGRYHRIDYRVEPVPRLGEDDAGWMDQLLREKGLRGAGDN